MISDDRLEKIERLVCDHLNEETTPAKVSVVRCPDTESLAILISALREG